MRSLFLIFSIFFIQSCSDSINTKFDQCFVEENTALSLNEIIVPAEQYLIEAGLIKDNSAKSYFNYAQELLNEDAKFPESFPIDILQKLNAFELSNEHCKDMEGFEKSRMYEYGQSLSKELVNIDSNNPEKLYVTIIKLFEKNDFNYTSFKFMFIQQVTFHMANSLVLKSADQLKDWTNDLEEIKNKNVPVLDLTLIKVGLLFVDQKKIDMKYSEFEFRRFFFNNLENSTEEIELPDGTFFNKSIGLLKITDQTGFKTNDYSDLIRNIEKTYKTIRDEMAVKIFKTKYRKLPPEQKQIIDEITPVYISVENEIVQK